MDIRKKKKLLELRRRREQYDHNNTPNNIDDDDDNDDDNINADGQLNVPNLLRQPMMPTPVDTANNAYLNHDLDHNLVTPLASNLTHDKYCNESSSDAIRMKLMNHEGFVLNGVGGSNDEKKHDASISNLQDRDMNRQIVSNESTSPTLSMTNIDNIFRARSSSKNKLRNDCGIVRPMNGVWDRGHRRRNTTAGVTDVILDKDCGHFGRKTFDCNLNSGVIPPLRRLNRRRTTSLPSYDFKLVNQQIFIDKDDVSDGAGESKASVDSGMRHQLEEQQSNSNADGTSHAPTISSYFSPTSSDDDGLPATKARSYDFASKSFERGKSSASRCSLGKPRRRTRRRRTNSNHEKSSSSSSSHSTKADSAMNRHCHQNQNQAPPLPMDLHQRNHEDEISTDISSFIGRGSNSDKLNASWGIVDNPAPNGWMNAIRDYSSSSDGENLFGTKFDSRNFPQRRRRKSNSLDELNTTLPKHSIQGYHRCSSTGNLQTEPDYKQYEVDTRVFSTLNSRRKGSSSPSKYSASSPGQSCNRTRRKDTYLNCLIFACGAFFGGLLSSISLLGLIKPTHDVWSSHQAQSIMFGSNGLLVYNEPDPNVISWVLLPFMFFVSTQNMPWTMCAIYFSLTCNWLIEFVYHSGHVQVSFPPLSEILLGFFGLIWAISFTWTWNWRPFFTDQKKFSLRYCIVASIYFGGCCYCNETLSQYEMESRDASAIKQLYAIYSSVGILALSWVDNCHARKYEVLSIIAIIFAHVWFNANQKYLLIVAVVFISVVFGPVLRDTALADSEEYSFQRKIILCVGVLLLFQRFYDRENANLSHVPSF